MNQTGQANTAAIALPRPQLGVWSRAADFFALAKPRILALELVVVVAAAMLAAPRGLDPWLLLHTILGTALLAASAGALNQWLERGADARMRRTADRPLPSGRLVPWQVLAFGAITLVLGTLELATLVRPTAAFVGVVTWLLYVAVYTPLKTRSPANTAIGAVGGALPILIGWTATGAPLDLRVLAMTAVLFLWQFPHFMAIAWLYREDYARAGHRMLTVIDPTGLRAGAQAVTAALVLIPVSLVPALSPLSGSPGVYAFWALVLGVGQFVIAAAFLVRRDDASARRLLRASLLYLPSWMLLLLVLSP